MGGRGSNSGGGGGIGKATKGILNANTKFSASEIKSMSRSQLETAARAIFIKQNVARGLSLSEADYRARSLMSGNSTTALRKYVKRHG